MLNQSLTLPCGRTLKNRIAKSAMSEYLANKKGVPGKGFEHLYRRWAKGGVGLNITGNVMIDSRSKEEGRNTVLEDKTNLDAWKRYASAGKENNTDLWIQLNHPGRQARGHASKRIVSASDVQLPFMKAIFKKPEALTEEGIIEIIKRFGNTAELAKEAGFTGVQMHSAHGYLLSQFLSPHVNQRQDNWGGNLENRSRLLLSVYAEIRQRVGNDFPIGVKINSADFQRGGFTQEDSLQVIRMLSEAGIDLIEISGGTYENPVMVGPEKKQSTIQREAFFLDFIVKARQVTKTPLMLTGGFRTKAAMVGALENGELDVIGIARPFATYPDLPNQLISGKLDKLPSEVLTTGSKLIDGIAVLDVYWYADQMKRMANQLEPDLKLGTWGTFFKNTKAQIL
jgi:2,4-dienoyl-CoA reductase-like NADH-dependent reductase (Old Yellow Enzyme family)